MSVDADVQQTLKAIGGIDASRRVGWAKAYTAETKLDEVLQQLNVARSDGDQYRKRLSFICGFLQVWLEVTDAEIGIALEGYTRLTGSVLEDAQVRHGKDRARQIIENSEPIKARRQERRDLKKAAAASYRKGWEEGQDKLARDMGYKNRIDLKQRTVKP